MPTIDNYDHFHDLTTIGEIVIVKKNFNFPLNNPLDFTKETYFDIEIRDTIEEDVENQNVYSVIKNISVIVKDSQDLDLANIGILYSFNLSNEEKFISKTETGFEMNSDFSEWLDHIIIATTRGIMYSEFRGTFVVDTLLPLIRPRTLK